MSQNPDQTPPPPTLLVDTTLQIERQKIPKQAKITEDAIGNFRFRASSSFSRLETKSSWIARLAYLHAESKQVGSIEELLARINARLGAHPANRRKLSTCIEAIAAIADRVPCQLTKKARLIRFRFFVVTAVLSMNTWWDRSIDHEFDGTKCVRARELPEFDRKNNTITAGIARCVPSKIACEIHNFYKQNRTHFDAIVQAVEQKQHSAAESPELQTAAAEFKKAAAKPEHLCDDHVCRKVGDCLIAVDGCKMSHFGSTNTREWVPLSNLFNKTLINPRKAPADTTK